MKQSVITLAAVLSISLAVPAFAAEEVQPPSAQAALNFEQVKADHLRRLEARIKSLHDERTCVEAAKNHGELSACRFRHRSEMKEIRGEIKKRGGLYRPGDPGTPEVK